MTSRSPENELAAALEEKRLLSDLAENKGFLLLSSLVQSQVDTTQQDILFTPCAGVDRAMEQEYKKGGLEGRLAWENVRVSYIASLDITITHLREKLNDYDDGPTEHTSAP